MISLQRGVQHFPRGGSNFFQGGGGGGVQMLISIENHITCDFPGGGGGGGGVGTPYPPLDPHKGSPDATVMVNQNLNKNEKYHPRTTKRK